jgi:hypothetical protein
MGSVEAAKSTKRTHQVGRRVRKTRERTQGVSGATPGPRVRTHGQPGGKDGTHRTNGINAGPRRGGANRRNKAMIVGEEGIAPIGGIQPTSGGNLRVAGARTPSVHRMGGIGAPVPTESARPDGQARGGGRAPGTTAAGLVRRQPRRRSGAGHPRGVGVPSLTSARNFGRAQRPDESGTSGWEIRRI